MVNQFTRTMAPSGPNYGAGGRSYGTRTRLAWDRPVYHRRGAGIDRGRGLDCPVTSGHQAILRGGFLRKDRSGRKLTERCFYFGLLSASKGGRCVPKYHLGSANIHRWSLGR